MERQCLYFTTSIRALFDCNNFLKERKGNIPFYRVMVYKSYLKCYYMRSCISYNIHFRAFFTQIEQYVKRKTENVYVYKRRRHLRLHNILRTGGFSNFLCILQVVPKKYEFNLQVLRLPLRENCPISLKDSNVSLAFILCF